MPKSEIGKKITKAIDAGEKVFQAAKQLKKALEDLKPPDQPAQT